MNPTKNKLELKPMTVVKLKVVRKNDFGAFLNAGTGNSNDDILLHNTQQTAKVNVGEFVEVFLYLDPKKRLTASMRLPRLKVGQIAQLKIINVTNDGAFVDAGAERGIFMPFAEMHGRPQVDDVVWAKLYVDKSGRLATSMKVSDEMRRASKPAENIQVGDKVNGRIFNITESGAFFLTRERNIAFIAQKETPRTLKVGEVVEARVTFIRDDGRINASLRDSKEKALDKDSEKILKFIRENGGEMSLNDKTDPKKIQAIFHISKAAFKRAVGHLLKLRLIEKIDGGFKLT